MGSVEFDIKDQSQPSTSNGKKYKLPRTLLDDGGANGHDSIPRKLRSAIKKRGREWFTPPLPIFRKQCHGFEPRKDCGKKSKPNTKQGNITKDEEEVAETLYALADMFCDENKANSLATENENPETKLTAKSEAGSPMNKAEDLVSSIGEVVKFQSVHDTQQPALPKSEQPATSTASGNQSESLSSRSRASNNHIIPSCEQVTAMEKVAESIQHDKNYCPMDGKINSLFMSHSLSPAGALSSQKPELFLRLPESKQITSSQPFLVGNSVTTLQHNQAPDTVQSKRSMKRSSTHVYISRLIKVLKTSETKGCFIENPTQTTQLNTHNQTTGRDGGVPFINTTLSTAVNASAGIRNDIPRHERPLQDLHLTSENSASCSSTNQTYNFLSLGTGASVLDTSEGIDRTGHVRETPKQVHAPYLQSHSQAAMLFPLPQNGYTSTFQSHDLALASKRVQHPQYPSSTLQQQQKWISHAQLPAQYNNGGINTRQLLDWKVSPRDSRSMLNYAHRLFPNLHAALGSKYQQFSHPQQQHLMNAINSSQLPLSELNRHSHPHLPLGFDRNGAPFYPDNMSELQLQLPCNQHLPS